MAGCWLTLHARPDGSALISYPQAIEHIARALRPARAVQLAPGDALGGGLHTPVTSKLDVPDFDNAAMDGIAVRAVDVSTASEKQPAALKVVGTLAAGHSSQVALRPGEAMEIMTGAPLPSGADTVIPVERLRWREEPAGCRFAMVEQALEAGRNVRRAGEDFCAGDELLRAGALLGPETAMNLAAGGVDDIKAILPPTVAVITTGGELTSTGAPTGTGRIRDSNGPYLAAGLAPMGGRLTSLRSAADTTKAIAAALEANAGESQVVLTTGGVSAGKFDCVPAAIDAAGGEIIFHKVGIRPGKPILFASLPGERWLFGLPGNPVAVAVGLRFFVAPALRLLRGLDPERPLKAVSTRAIRKHAGLRFFGKASATVSETGRLEVELLPGQESFRVRPLLHANCWAIVTEARETVQPGELIDIAPLHPTPFLQHV